MVQLDDLKVHYQRFDDYYHSISAQWQANGEESEPLRLKWEHSLKVASNAEFILQDGAIEQEFTRAAQLAALYHDVARFAQYVQYQTFRDAESADHGAWGCKILKQEEFLADESADTAAIVRAAVSMHNRLSIPMALPYAYRAVTNVVRDADKIDILRVLADYMGPGAEGGNVVVANLPSEPDLWTQSIYDSIMEGCSGSYTDMRYLNDFRLLVCSWVYSINYSASLALIAEQGHIHTILSGLPAGEAMDKIRARICNKLGF